MHFIADIKFQPFDLCSNSSCSNCVFSSYHTGYYPIIGGIIKMTYNIRTDGGWIWID